VSGHSAGSAIVAGVQSAVARYIRTGAPAAAIKGYVTSLVRTLTPMLAGFALVHVPAVSSRITDSQAQSAVGFGLAFGWYAAVRFLESRWPKVGVLLGVPVAPTYSGPTVVDLMAAPLVVSPPLPADVPDRLAPPS